MSKEIKVRNRERDKLIEQLMAKVSSMDDAVYLELAEVIIIYLRSRQTGKLELEKRNEITRLFFNYIVPAVNSFARADEERGVLYAELLKKILYLALVPVYDALLSLENRNPRLIFGPGAKMTGQ